MAIETRPFIFERDENSEILIVPRTLALPVDREYHGVTSVTGDRQVLFVRGEWDTTESVDIEFTHTNNLPTSSAIIGVASSRDDSGFSGVVVEL